MRTLNDCIKEDKSKADKMFEKLGYKVSNIMFTGEFTQLARCKKRTRQWREDGYIEIGFNYDKTVDVCFSGEISDNLPAFLDMQELQAINEKCKELGWLDER